MTCSVSSSMLNLPCSVQPYHARTWHHSRISAESVCRQVNVVRFELHIEISSVTAV